MDPLVSAIIPAYNRLERTSRAVASVVEQHYSPIEIIVVDDGSQPPIPTDVLPADDAVRAATIVRHDGNRGANVARNTGINHANGEYVAFLDSDDEWEPTKIDRQIGQLTNSDYEASYTSVKQVDSSGKVNAVRRAASSGDLSDSLITGNVIGTFSSFCISASAIDRAGRPDPALPAWQDWEWYLRLSETVAFGAIEEPLTIRHNEGDQISSSFTPKRDVAYPAVLEQIHRLSADDSQLRVGKGHATFQLGYSALSNHRFSEARSLFLRAIQTLPTEPKFYLFLSIAGPQYSWSQRAKRFLVRMTQ